MSPIVFSHLPESAQERESMDFTSSCEMQGIFCIKSLYWELHKLDDSMLPKIAIEKADNEKCFLVPASALTIIFHHYLHATSSSVYSSETSSSCV